MVYLLSSTFVSVNRILEDLNSGEFIKDRVYKVPSFSSLFVPRGPCMCEWVFVAVPPFVSLRSRGVDSSGIAPRLSLSPPLAVNI